MTIGYRPRCTTAERREMVPVESSASLELVHASAEFKQVGTGITSTEGLSWNPNGCPLFGEVWQGRDSDARSASSPSTGKTGGNGMTIDSDGRLVVSEHVAAFSGPPHGLHEPDAAFRGSVPGLSGRSS
jgi:hypothetical protein